ncbi:MAG TPA: hypothetical protein VGS01_02760 [Candidatus Limnocylindria bacterium]|jgi:hypothetical protein|nr:hypothetical protein [Candidatus Limnocylindria bacterium]
MTTLAAHDVLATRAADLTVEQVRAADREWRTLFRIGGLAAFSVLALVPLQMIVFFVWPPPASVVEWFALFQRSAVIGLLDMDLLMIVDYGLLAVFFLALYAALHRADRSLMAIALVAEGLAVAAYFASTTAFEMLSLSAQYAGAATEAERSASLAAGQAVYAAWQGTAFDVSYVLSSVAVLIASVVMLRSRAFGRTAAYAGLAMGAAGLVPPTVGGVGLVLSLVSLLPMWVWLFITGRGLLRLAR